MAPGWTPLLIAAYWLVDAGLPEDVLAQRLGLSVSLPDPVWALVITLMFYPIGDWLDERIFYRRLEENQDGKRVKCHRLTPSWVTTERAGVQATLQIQADTYRVGKAIAQAADRWRWPGIVNEAAKFLRSLPVPLFLAAVLALGTGTTAGRMWIAGVTVAAIPAYTLLKLWHIRLLYREVRALPWGQEGLSVAEGWGGKGFLWRGQLIATADQRRQDPCAAEIAS